MGNVIHDICGGGTSQETKAQKTSLSTHWTQYYQDHPAASEIRDLAKNQTPLQSQSNLMGSMQSFQYTSEPSQPPTLALNKRDSVHSLTLQPDAAKNWNQSQPTTSPPPTTQGSNTTHFTFANDFTPCKSKVSMRVEDFELIQTIGKGAFGKVFLAKYKPSGMTMALKKMKKKDIEKMMQVENVLTEKVILQKNSHPFIVKLLCAFQNDSSIYLGMEYMPGGELFFHLRRKKRFGEAEALFYSSEVLLAIEYLHETLGIIYRDLKPENVLLDRDGHIKLTDFGLSKMDKLAQSFCGTPEYFAPEIIKREEYDKAVDWWSFGCFLYELLSGKPPFEHESRDQLFNMILNRKLYFPPGMSMAAIDLINGLLTVDPKKRLGKTVDEVKHHPFFSAINWTKVFNKGMEPPFKPQILHSLDVSNFDDVI